MSLEGAAFQAEMLHDAAEREPRRLVPDRSLLVRGLGLAGLAIGGFAGAVKLIQRGSWPLAPVAVVLAGAAVLASWAAAIHLTGGERFDDHRWV